MNNSKNKLKPIQILNLEKQKLTKQCYQHEQIIGEQINYIQQNAGQFIVKGAKLILFPKILTNNNPDTKQPNGANNPNVFLALMQNYMPMIVEIVRPMIVTWGMNKLRQNLNVLLQKL